jgi:hypothetical protein
VAEQLVSKGVPAMFLTAYGHGIELPQTLMHLQVISKPFSSALLAEAILKALDAGARPSAEPISCISMTG